ncbi:MAG: hypothetical protein ACKVU1_04530 [bacterium]
MLRTRILAPFLAAILLPVAATISPAFAASGASESLARLFENIPVEKIETGVLYDRVLGLSRIGDHDGSELSASATLSEWRQIYSELSRASLREPAWPPLEQVMKRGGERAQSGVVPIALLNVRYNRVRADAIERGALVATNGRLALGSANGAPDAAFETRRVFAAAALVERTYHGAGVRFRIASDDYYSNDANAAPQSERGTIEIDFDDGRGFVAAGFDRDLRVDYSSAGTKHIRLRLATTERDSERAAPLTASFPFEVASLGAPLPNDTLAITASIPYLGQAGTGSAYVYLAPNHAALTNPILVIEGFDLDNSMNWDELYALLNREQLLESLRALGYDAVVLNFTNAIDYVQRNSLVVVELIEQVEASIDPSRSIAIAGASMGGLASRYALAYMESQSRPNRVRTFVSFDSPQLGADIPLGMQYWLAFFSDDSAEAAALLAALDSPAARQMLVYHHTSPPGATGQSDPLRAGLIADLAAIGDYPDAPRNVAIANGSGAQTNQGFNAGAQIVRWEYDGLFVDITGNVWSVPNSASQDIFRGEMRVIFTPPEQQTVTVAGTLPYDGAPGGSRASMAEMDAVSAPFGDIIALHPSHCFIPTVSALALAAPDLFYDVANDPQILQQTPFDAVYFPLANEEHVLITPQNVAWLLAELQDGVTSVSSGSDAVSGAPLRLSASPNPFADATRIRWTMPRSGAARLAVFDASGREAAVVADAVFGAGDHEADWDGRDPSGRRLSAGIYFIALRGGDGSHVRKVLLR